MSDLIDRQAAIDAMYCIYTLLSVRGWIMWRKDNGTERTDRPNP